MLFKPEESAVVATVPHLESQEILGNSLKFPLAGQTCHNINKCNKTSGFLILKQYYTKFPFIFIIYSNKKSQCIITAV